MLNAYYFRHHFYSIVPRHVRADMEWMRDIGTTAVSLAILEQDLYAARANVDIICAEAQRVGIAVWAVPSRWGGLVAGAPKVPSLFAANHPATWSHAADGTPHITQFGGPQCSVFHPQLREFWRATLDQVITQWPIAGVVWDEPKNLYRLDYSPHARAALSEISRVTHLSAVADFFDAMGAGAKTTRPDLKLGMFSVANASTEVIERLARIESLDDFGCDGRPWRLEDGGTLQAPDKVLIGRGERFLQAARANDKRGFLLIENHDMTRADDALMEKRLPEVTAMNADYLIYYYYPRNIPDPEAQMKMLGAQLRDWASSRRI